MNATFEIKKVESISFHLREEAFDRYLLGPLAPGQNIALDNMLIYFKTSMEILVKRRNNGISKRLCSYRIYDEFMVHCFAASLYPIFDSAGNYDKLQLQIAIL